MVDLDKIRELLELMGEHDLSEIKIQEGETRICLRKGPSGEPMMVQAAPAAMAPAAPAAPQEAPPAAEPGRDDGLVPLPCPMVGTLYNAPDPESPPFVKVGSEVDANTVICVIEAMKVFNEIKAEVAGTIERVLVQNQQAVEFGQPLMLVRPKS